MVTSINARLFIGGPMDGTREAVRGTRITVPYLGATQYPVDDASTVTSRVPINVATYILREISTPGGGVLVFVDDAMTLKDALVALVNGYTPPSGLSRPCRP